MHKRITTVGLVVYWLALFSATHWPREFLPEDGRLPGNDKFLHFTAYAGLAALLSAAVAARRGIAALGIRATIVVWLVVVAAALVDETTQPWVNRDLEWADWLADSAGATLGCALWFVAARRIGARTGAAQQNA